MALSFLSQVLVSFKFPDVTHILYCTKLWTHSFIRPRAIYSSPCNLKNENHRNKEKNYRKKYILASSQSMPYYTKDITRFNDKNNDQKIPIEWCHKIG